MNFIFDPGLVLYLPLYELSGNSFMSRDAWGHLCTVTGALLRPDGRWFDGSDDYINCGDPDILDPTEAATIEVWVKPGANDGGRIIFNFDWTAKAGYRFLFEAGCARAYFGNGSNAVYVQVPNSQTPVGEWHLWSATFNSTIASNNVKFYLDGILKDQNTLSGTLSYPALNVLIGKANWGSYFQGAVGEVRVYRRVLSPQEIQRKYLATKWRYQ